MGYSTKIMQRRWSCQANEIVDTKIWTDEWLWTNPKEGNDFEQV